VSGVLEWVAVKLASKANTSLRLFFVVFGTASVFTILTSNDVVILTLTPIVCTVCASLEREPQPFLVSMFFAANIWSVLLVIGNPTNVIVATAYSLDFVTYTAWMGLPAVCEYYYN
jgi:arsenical pump membrane protein